MWLIAAGLLGLVALVAGAQTSGAQKHKGVFITRLYTGPDGQTHAEEIEAKFTPGSGNDVFKMLTTTGAELHRAPAGRVSDWHTAPPPIRHYFERPWRARSGGWKKDPRGAGTHRAGRRHDRQGPHHESHGN